MGAFQLGRDLTDEQVRVLVAFLGALSGELPAEARPPATPSEAPTVPTVTGEAHHGEPTTEIGH